MQSQINLLSPFSREGSFVLHVSRALLTPFVLVSFFLEFAEREERGVTGLLWALPPTYRQTARSLKAPSPAETRCMNFMNIHSRWR